MERKFKLLGLMQFYLWILKDLNVSVITTCLHIFQQVPSHDLQEAFFFSRGTFALTRISFKFLALLNTPVGISKTFPRFLSGANSKFILDSTFFESTGLYVILKTNLLLFPTLFCFFETSDLENFLALGICLLTNL